jgi:chemotaxis protein methyltransferase CheR
LVAYDVDGADWRLSVSDNGVGLRKSGDAHTGLGTKIVAALAKQLNARVQILSTRHGTAVSITHSASHRGRIVLIGGSAARRRNRRDCSG